MEVLNGISDIDSKIIDNPNSVLVIYRPDCPWCMKIQEDLKSLEEEGLAKVYLLPVEKAGPLLKKVGAQGVPVTISFRECELTHVFDGYDESIAKTLSEEYKDAKPVCRVNLSEVLFDRTLLGEPII